VSCDDPDRSQATPSWRGILGVPICPAAVRSTLSQRTGSQDPRRCPPARAGNV